MSTDIVRYMLIENIHIHSSDLLNFTCFYCFWCWEITKGHQISNYRATRIVVVPRPKKHSGGNRLGNFLRENLVVLKNQNVIPSLQGAVYIHYTDIMFRSSRIPFFIGKDLWIADTWSKNILFSCFILKKCMISLF